MSKIDVSIVIVSYNTENITYECVNSIFNSITKFNYEVILVDNNSFDNTVEKLRQNFCNLKIIKSPKNLGFSKANNLGIKMSSGTFVLLLNSDTILFEDSLENLVNTAIEKKYQISGPILLNKNLTIQRSWFNFPSKIKIFLRLTNLYHFFYQFSNSFFFKIVFSKKKPAFMLNSIREDTVMDYLTFAAILINRDVIIRIGYLDENLFFYQEDCEYGLRAKKNDINFIYTISSKIIHLGGSTSSNFSEIAFENDILGLLYIYKKHYSNVEFNLVRLTIYLALYFRITLYYIGFFKSFKKSRLYDNSSNKFIRNNQALQVYKKLKKIVKNYN